jgi:hypothetical protein
MQVLTWGVGLFLVAGSFGPALARQPHTVEAVEPAGPGMLTKCRNWLIASSCNTYHHITLPARIAVGDTITISFGSSPKDYTFSVTRIALKGKHCTIFSEADKINVASCYLAGEGR